MSRDNSNSICAIIWALVSDIHTRIYNKTVAQQQHYESNYDYDNHRKSSNNSKRIAACDNKGQIQDNSCDNDKITRTISVQ